MKDPLTAFRTAGRMAPPSWQRWHRNNYVGDIVRIDNAAAANERLGHCWMKGRLMTNDLVLCVDHTGDGFHDYVLIEKRGSVMHGCGSLKAHIGSNFGSYGIGGGTKVFTLEEDDFVELLTSAGKELVATSTFRSAREAQRGEHLQKLMLSF